MPLTLGAESADYVFDPGLRSVFYVACLQIGQGARCYAFNLKEDQQAGGEVGGGGYGVLLLLKLPIHH
jgi:hypothetical protein